MNGLVYHHLDENEVRRMMLTSWEEEREELITAGLERDCYGKDLTDEGWEAFINAMPTALEQETDLWLAGQMELDAYWKPQRWDKRGRWVNYNKPQALEMLSISEFNIAYIRGLATALQAEGTEECEIFRAGSAMEKDKECTAWERKAFPVQQLIDGHRARYWPPPGDRAAWSLPTQPGCHHSICRIGAGQF